MQGSHWPQVTGPVSSTQRPLLGTWGPLPSHAWTPTLSSPLPHHRPGLPSGNPGRFLVWMGVGSSPPWRWLIHQGWSPRSGQRERTFPHPAGEGRPEVGRLWAGPPTDQPPLPGGAGEARALGVRRAPGAFLPHTPPHNTATLELGVVTA